MVDIFYVYLYVGYLYVNQKMVLEAEIILREIVCVYREFIIVVYFFNQKNYIIFKVFQMIF